MNYRTKYLLSGILNLLIILLTAYSCYRMFFYGAEGNMNGIRFESLKYFTVLSNIFCALTCIPVMVKSFICLASPVKDDGHRRYVSKGLLAWKLSGTTAVTVTFVVVLAILMPMTNFAAMFSGANLFLHGVNPVLAILSFCFFDRGESPKFKNVFLADIPVLVYGIVYAVMVLVIKKWGDFYYFTVIAPWYVTFALMIVGGFVLALLLYLLHAACNRKNH